MKTDQGITLEEYNEALAICADIIEKDTLGYKLISWFDRLDRERDELINGHARLNKRLAEAKARVKSSDTGPSVE